MSASREAAKNLIQACDHVNQAWQDMLDKRREEALAIAEAAKEGRLLDFDGESQVVLTVDQAAAIKAAQAELVSELKAATSQVPATAEPGPAKVAPKRPAE